MEQNFLLATDKKAQNLDIKYSWRVTYFDSVAAYLSFSCMFLPHLRAL